MSVTRVVRQGTVYAVSAVASKLGGLVLLAFYVDTDVLPKAEFGHLGVLDATKAVALLVGGAGLAMGVLRFASAGDLSDRERAAVPATALALAALTAAVVGGLGWVGAPRFAAWLFGDPARAEPFRWLAVYVALRAVADVPYAVLRQREEVGRFVLVGLAEMVVVVAAVFFFLVVRGEGLTGVMKGYAVSAAVLVVALTPALLARVDRRVRWSLVRPLLLFCLPLVASGLAGWVLSLGDRYLLVALLGPERTAEYELAARFGGLVNTVVVQSFALAFTVLGLKSLGDSADPAFHRRAFRHLAAFAGWCALGLGLFYSDLVGLLPTTDPAYARADGVVLLVAGGAGLYGLYIVTVNVLYAAGRTWAVAGTVGLAGAANLALNVVLIPALGLAGAALATLVAYGLLAYATGRAADRSLRAGYPWGAVLVVAAVVGALWALGQPADPWALGPRLALRTALVLLYPAALLGLGVYTRDDGAEGLRRIAAWRRGEHGGSTR